MAWGAEAAGRTAKVAAIEGLGQGECRTSRPPTLGSDLRWVSIARAVSAAADAAGGRGGSSRTTSPTSRRVGSSRPPAETGGARRRGGDGAVGGVTVFGQKMRREAAVGIPNPVTASTEELGWRRSGRRRCARTGHGQGRESPIASHSHVFGYHWKITIMTFVHICR